MNLWSQYLLILLVLFVLFLIFINNLKGFYANKNNNKYLCETVNKYICLCFVQMCIIMKLLFLLIWVDLHKYSMGCKVMFMRHLVDVDVFCQYKIYLFQYTSGIRRCPSETDHRFIIVKVLLNLILFLLKWM